MRLALPALVAAAIALLPASMPESRADEVTLTPDQRNFLVSFEASGRWTLSLNRDAARNLENFSGTILAADGSFIFVDCRPRADSTGSLSDANSVFRFDCFRMGPCLDTATACSQDGWGPLTDARGLELSARYFVPPNGVGAASLAGAVAMLRTPPSSPARTEAAAAEGVAATLGKDRLRHLLSFEFGGRWAASLNKEHFSDAEACRSTRLTSLTGNVFRGGQPPVFVHCTPLDAQNDLSNPNNTFRFTCRQAGPCTTTASDCAERSWGPLSDNLALPASYFLPPGGLGGFVPSDPDVKPVGKRCDPASGGGGIAGPASVGQSAAWRSALAAAAPVAGGACPVGASCRLRVGSCNSLSGQMQVIDGLCLCAVQSLPESCVICGGGGATGQAGGACSFPVGASTARGACVPFAAETTQTACKFILPGQDLQVRGCGGSLGDDCGAGACCTDDPTDGCDPGEDNAERCPGVCVDSAGCDPSQQQCGTCFAPPSPQCVGPGGSCFVNGAITPGVCCEGLACGIAFGFPTPVCGFLSECRQEGASCSSDGQCCSECCSQGVCSHEEFCF